jgi:hypothetical protein
MTDRHSGYVVILSHDIRKDDAEAIIAAIQMIKGVKAVKPIVAEPSAGSIVESRIKMEVADRLREVARG